MKFTATFGGKVKKIKLNHNEQTRLIETVERLTQAGIPQKGIASQLSKFGSKKEKIVGEKCLEVIGQGKSFTYALQPFLSQNVFLALLSGDKAGSFSQGVTDALSALNVEKSSTASLLKVLVKPFFGLIGLFTASALASWGIFPKLAEQLPRQRWDGLSSFAEQFGLFWLNNGLALLVFVAVIGLLVTFSLGRWTGTLREHVDHWPIYRQYRFIHCTNLLTATAHQMAIGVSLKKALTQYQEQSPPYLQAHIGDMLEKIGRGTANIGHIFDTGLLIEEEMDSMKILGSIGDAPTTLKKSATMHTNKLQHEINTLKTLCSNGFKLIAALVGVLLVFGLVLLFFNIATNFI